MFPTFSQFLVEKEKWFQSQYGTNKQGGSIGKRLVGVVKPATMAKPKFGTMSVVKDFSKVADEYLRPAK